MRSTMMPNGSFYLRLVLLVCFLVARDGWAWSPGTSQRDATAGFTVNRTDRRDVLAFHNTVYNASEGYAARMAWTGNVTRGPAGTTSAEFKRDVLRRINYYRALTGLPADIFFNDTKSAKCQEAALMFSAAGSITHYPPSSWTHYTANASEAARNSNIAYGSYGPGSVDAYIRDDGGGNYLVGHRRWLLYSRAQEMGTGDAPPSGSKPSANAIWVMGQHKASAPASFVAWPTIGFTPKNLIPARWSLSYPNANFGSASVTMRRNGVSVPLQIVSSAQNGYGENTIVWEPTSLVLNSKEDQTYQVTVSNIGGSGIPTSTSYSVTIFDPTNLGESVAITGPALPSPATKFGFNPIAQADRYQLRVSRESSAGWLEGAEDSPASKVVQKTSAYSFRQSTMKRSGAKAFYLAFPSVSDGSQSFEIDREILPGPSAVVTFHDLFRFATSTTRLSLEVSADSGLSWSEIWGRNGNGSGNWLNWDQVFQARSISLAKFAGQPIRLRFILRFTGSAYFSANFNDGVFLDDIAVSGADELVDTKVTELPASASNFVLNDATAGAPLGIGQKYHLRIRPEVGTVWFGDGPLKTVQISGADTAEPVVQISSPLANARLTSANASFSGTIVEVGSKPTLQYRLGTAGNWTASSLGGTASPYSFLQTVTLKPGANTVQFQAKDLAGNTSAVASLNVSYVVPSTLKITAPNTADGSLTSGFGGSTSREVGVSYTVTATPASGMVFKEWLKNGTRISTNATLSFTMEPGLNLTPVFVPDFAKLGGFYNGLIGTGAIGNGSTADRQAFTANNGFLQITSSANGSLSGVLKIEGKSHSFTGTMGANKRATITVARSGKSNATLSMNLTSALPGEISGTVSTGGVPISFRALRGGYMAGAAKHALAGKRYAIVLPPPTGLAMGYGHAALTLADDGSALLSVALANGQALNAEARIVDDGAGNWVFPVYADASGLFTGEIVIPKSTPASGSELGGSLEWLKPASNMGLFKSGFLKSLQPLGATHSITSAGLGGAAFRLTLDPAKRILAAPVVQTGAWGNGAPPTLTTPVQSGLKVVFSTLSGKFEGNFTRTANGAAVSTPFQGTLFSRPISIPGGVTLRGAGFFISGNASTALEVTSNGTLEVNGMISVAGGTLPAGSSLSGQKIAAFRIGKFEVTWSEWKAVRAWAVANGYSDLSNVGSAGTDSHPVDSVSWYDALKWCNAKSQKEGLTPVYQAGGLVYKTGQTVPTVNAAANGYRLPTEAEWEWAARGGITSQGYTYAGSNDVNAVAWHSGNSASGPKTVGSKAANELGIYDMSGNLWEWCWNSYQSTARRIRGGSWWDSFSNGDVSKSYFSYNTTGRHNNNGFRLARNSGN
jgi:hypothetical protein